MMIKSALMTSASDVLDGPNTNQAVIFRQGAGHVQPNKAADPGLAYDAGVNDWLAFLCGATTGVNPSVCSQLGASGYSLDPSDLNVASIAIGDLAGVQTITRRVTNVGKSAATYNAAVTGMTGFTVAVSPSSLTLSAGQTKPYSVHYHTDDRDLQYVHRRPADLERWNAQRAHSNGGPAARPCRSVKRL
jgi:hypothetical protein